MTPSTIMLISSTSSAPQMFGGAISERYMGRGREDADVDVADGAAHEDETHEELRKAVQGCLKDRADDEPDCAEDLLSAEARF